MSWGFWDPKITQRRSAKFTTTTTIMYIKMLQYSHYTYCLLKESALVNLRISTYFGLEIMRQFRIDIHKGKIRNFDEDIANYTLFY